MPRFSPAVITRAFRRVPVFARTTWTRFRALKLWQQGLIAVAVLALLIGIAFALSGHDQATADTQRPTVTLASVGSLSGTGGTMSTIGTIRSVSEATILAQAGGTVRAVHAKVGQHVAAGTVLAELDNATERATVLQAEGGYDAAVAARAITATQSGGTTQTLAEAATSARNTYQSTYATLDTVLHTYVDTFFGSYTPYGPRLLLTDPTPEFTEDLSRGRTQLETMLQAWHDKLARSDTRDPEELLNEAEADLRQVSAFLDRLSRASSSLNSGATDDQKASLASARSSVNTMLATVSATRDAYRAKRTANQVSDTQTRTTTGRTSSADAAVKTALGSLRYAQANLEKTLVRAPISGTVNFLPIHVGDYVTSFMHVATVAQNGALEAVAYVSEEDRAHIAVGDKVGVDANGTGIITSIAPALDPATRQIEVHVAVENGGTTLVNGKSVRITFANAAPAAAVEGPIMLPLASVKLRANDRIVFTVDETGTLIAHPVEIGDVRGDRIEITSGLSADLRIVADARGLAEGQKVQISGQL